MTRTAWRSLVLALRFTALAGFAASGASCSSSSGAAFVSHDAGADCGGRTGNPCGDGAACEVPADCQSGLCHGGVCAAPPAGCEDGQKDNAETDIDCGGGACSACGTGKVCVMATDCASEVCESGECRAASPADGVKNDSETDTDCGGALQKTGQANPSSDGALACLTGRACVFSSDCVEGVCDASPTTEGQQQAVDAGKGSGPLVCQAPTRPPTASRTAARPTSTAAATASRPATATQPPTARRRASTARAASSAPTGAGFVCNDNHDKGGGPLDCPAGRSCSCQVPWPNDGAHNDGETDIDCGGGNVLGSDGAPACAPGLHCKVASDCESLVCTGGTCQAASCTDSVKNGEESDVDCGGTTCSGCPVGKGCKISGDCATNGCNYKSVCVGAPSCVGHNGGDTCGPGESDQGVTTNEDCCLGRAGHRRRTTAL